MRGCQLLFFWIAFSYGMFTSPKVYAQLSSLGPHFKIDTLNFLLSKDKEDTQKVNHLVLLAREYSKENADTSYRIAQDAYELASTLHWNKGKGIAKIVMGWSLYILGSYEHAMACNYEAKKIGESIREPQIVMYAWSNLGQIFYSKDEISQAIDYNTRALLIAEKTGDLWNVARNIGIIGTAYHKDKQFSKAIHHFQEAYGLTEKIGNTNGSAVWLSNLGGVYLELEKYDSALFYLHKSSIIFDSIDNKWSYAETILDIAKIHTLNHRYEKALQILKHVLRLSTEVGAVECRDQAYLAISNIYQKAQRNIPALFSSRLLNRGDRKAMALEYYQRYIALKDSIENKESLKKMMAMEFEQKAATAQLEMDKQNAANKAQLKTQKIIRNAFIIGSLLLVVLIVLLINRNNLQRQIELNSIRNKLSRDLHDDIGSTLSSINILSKTAQHHRHHIGEERMKTALEKIHERSQRLLQNMNDIIWNINPENDNYEELLSRMREYASSILDIANIRYEFTLPEGLKVNKLDTVIKTNVYLIFKEAVNNMCKYSEASQVIITMKIHDGKMLLSVEDNGHGFVRSELKREGGLKNMQMRAQEIGGQLSVESGPGSGTRIKLQVPKFC